MEHAPIDASETGGSAACAPVSYQSLLRVALVGACIWLLVQVWPVLLILLGALILVGTLNPFATFLQERGVSRTVAVAMLFLVLLVGLALGLLLVLPPLITQAWELIQAAPAAQARLATELARHHAPLRALAEPVRHFEPLEVLAEHSDSVIAWSRASVLGFAVTGTILTVAFYILVDPQRSQRLLFASIPRAHHVKTAVILSRLETIVGGYLRGQAITSFCMALFVFALLWLCGVPSPLPIAVFAGITDVLPFVGGLLGLVPAVAAAMLVDPGIALVVLLAVLLYQELENRILVPRIYGRALHLPPVVIVIALLAGGWLLGILGALLALPVAAGLVMLVEELQLEMPGRAGDKVDEAAEAARYQEPVAQVTD